MPKYPEEFVAAVKAAFPDWERLHQALDDDNEMVGRYLADSRCNGITAQTVLNKIETGDLNELKRMAERQILINRLYSDWRNIWHPVTV